MDKKEKLRLAKGLRRRVPPKLHRQRAKFVLKNMSVKAVCKKAGISPHAVYSVTMDRHKDGFPAWHKLVVDILYINLNRTISEMKKLARGMEEVKHAESPDNDIQEGSA